jgi:hypothetical protein
MSPPLRLFPPLLKAGGNTRKAAVNHKGRDDRTLRCERIMSACGRRTPVIAPAFYGILPGFSGAKGQLRVQRRRLSGSC